MTRVSRIIRIATAVGLALALGLLVACAPSTPAGEGQAQTTESEAPATPPTVVLTVPAAGATVPAGTVKVAVETTGLKFVMPGGDNVPGEGHVHFTLDDRPEVMSVEREAGLKDVEPGTHTLIAELVQNDTEPFDPPIKQEIQFIVE